MKHYKRYQIIALSRSGSSRNEISKLTGCAKATVIRWSQGGNIYDGHRRGRPPIYKETTQLKTIAFYCQTTLLQSCGRWSLRTAGKYIEKNPDLAGLPTSHATIQRLLKKHNLKPHRSKYFLHITDPDFFLKMEPLIGLYLKPPEYLFCFDECPGIQVLQRLAPDLQTEEMKIRLEEFEYIRNGTIDVFAFLRVKTGNVFADCKANHTIGTLIEVFEKHLKKLPENETVHYIMDNLASHSSYELCKLVSKYSRIECPPEKELNKTVKRRQWLQSENKRIVLHYTPFHGSWLNMVEIWFGILNQKCLNESFNSPESMYKAVYDFTNLWNAFLAHPFKWNYDGKGLHQKAVARFIKLLENNIANMNVKFMTKQFLLMQNLVQTYRNKVEFDIWRKLHQTIKANFDQLNAIIIKNAGAKTIKNAQFALRNLFDSLSSAVNVVQKYVA
ncbi:IS630 family transposase [Patescibacteria group bacterium]|nr:IS630 family transposase [Patescibacteria group bacterium]